MTNCINLNNKLVNFSKKTISLEDFSNNRITINIDLILTILENNECFRYFVKCLKNNEETNIDFYLSNQNPNHLIYNKVIIVKAILKLINQGIIVLNRKNKNKINYIYNLISIENFSFANQIHVFQADYKNFSIPISNYFDILFLDDKKFKEIIDLKTSVCSIKKRYFFYGLIKYLEEGKILEKYLFPDSIISRIKKIKNMEYVDYESINTYLNIDDNYKDDVVLNSNLENELLSDYEEGINLLEFLMSVYIKMCRMFTYDPFYLTNKLGKSALKHSDISNLQTISLTNNRIVCYEFTCIFAYILRKFGINYKIHQRGNEYGRNHSYLTFRYKEYIIKVDAVLSVFESDLTSVKINANIDGFTCLNKNIQTQTKFLKHLKKCYVMIYDKEEPDYYPIDIYEKLSLIMDKIKNLKLEIIDALAYFYRMKWLVLGNDQICKLVTIQKIENDLESPKPIIIIVFNTKNIDYNDNLYFVYDFPILKEITKREIEELFASNIYKFHDETNIPGIKINKMVY